MSPLKPAWPPPVLPHPRHPSLPGPVETPPAASTDGASLESSRWTRTECRRRAKDERPGAVGCRAVV